MTLSCFINALDEVLDLLEFAKNLTEAEQKSAEETVVQSSDDTIREPEPKRGKPDDQMDLH